MSRRPEIIVPDIIEDHLITPHNNKPYTKRYRKGKYLGKGGFAKVYEMVSYDTNRKYACKVIPKASLVKESSKRKLLNEIKIHRSLDHPGVVKFERFFEDKLNVYILLEVCPSQTLMELMHKRKRLSETETQTCMWQLMMTIRHLHGMNVIHRDLKLGNIFLDKNLDLKVGDFGLATRLEHPEERKRTLCGTPNYIAPEILVNNNGHSFEVDIWSLGVIMYTFLIGRPPFETHSVRTTYKRIRDNSYGFPRDVPISSAAKNLISTILNSTPELRPSLEDICNHEFFTQSPFPKSLPLSSRHCLPHNLMDGPLVNIASKNNKRPAFSDKTNLNLKKTSADNLLKPRLSKTGFLSKNSAPESGSLKTLQTHEPAVNLRKQYGRGGRAASDLDRIGTKRPSSSRTSKGRANTDFLTDVCPPPALTRAHSEIPANLRPSSSPQEFVYTKKTKLQVTSPGGGVIDAEERAEFKRVHGAIEKSFCFSGKPSGRTTSEAKSSMSKLKGEAAVAVNKWVDYSNKYGVGYLLTNGNVGVYFNDSSQIIISRNGTNFEYIPRRGELGGGSRMTHTMTNYPDSLQKKVKLLNHFRTYLNNKSSSDSTSYKGPLTSSNMVYVKKWLRTNHAILFRLSNQTVQVIFFDQTEILLSSSTRIVMYTDKKRNVSQYPLDAVVDSPRPDLARRMRYTQDILKHLLTSGSKRRGSV